MNYSGAINDGLFAKAVIEFAINFIAAATTIIKKLWLSIDQFIRGFV